MRNGDDRVDEGVADELGRGFEPAPAYDLTPNPLMSLECRVLASAPGRLKIRVSVGRFRPCPPLPTRSSTRFGFPIGPYLPRFCKTTDCDKHQSGPFARALAAIARLSVSGVRR
jgi:hypothetical protein